MLKKSALLTIFVVLAIILAAAPVYAKGENSNEAVKVDLVERDNWEVVVGSLILNTTANEKLVIDVNMDTEPNLEGYDVLVQVFYHLPTLPHPADAVGIFPDVLNTNAKGKGSAHVTFDIDPPPTNDFIWVIVAVGEQPPTPSTPPKYFNIPPPVEVPWKGKAPIGAVKVDLVEKDNWEVVVGSLILNTTASRKLIVDVNMDTEPNLEGYDVIVQVIYDLPVTLPHPADVFGLFPDVLNVNAKGKGNAHVTLDIDPPPTNDFIWVIVAVGEQPPTPSTPPKYFNIPPPVEVPLK